MIKLLSFLLVVAFAAAGLADSEVPLPGPGAPPTEPAPPQPTPPPVPQPTPPPYDPGNPRPTPYPTPYPTATPFPNPGGEVTYSLGSGTVGRFKERSFSFRPPRELRNIRGLRVTCTNRKVKIKSVKVEYRDGQIMDQFTLTGTYRLGDTRTTYLYGAPVRKVTVIASTSSIFRSNGAFRVDASAIQAKTNDIDPDDPEFGSENENGNETNPNYGDAQLEVHQEFEFEPATSGAF
jgi:hypothetical protein